MLHAGGARLHLDDLPQHQQQAQHQQRCNDLAGAQALRAHNERHVLHRQAPCSAAAPRGGRRARRWRRWWGQQRCISTIATRWRLASRLDSLACLLAIAVILIQRGGS